MKLMLTKLQRYTAYVIMLAEAEINIPKYKFDGFCNMILEIFNIHDNGTQKPGSYAHVIENFFPELKNKRYKGWPEWNLQGWEKRKVMLKQCIEETSPDK